MDLKAPGYLVSTLSVFLIGFVAWPSDGDPAWHAPVLVAGMATSIIGMGLRFVSHLQEQKEIRRTEAKARRR